MTDEAYEWVNKIWTITLTVQTTLLVTGLLLGDDRVVKASLYVAIISVVLGMVSLNERSKRIQAAKEASKR